MLQVSHDERKLSIESTLGTEDYVAIATGLAGSSAFLYTKSIE